MAKATIFKNLRKLNRGSALLFSITFILLMGIAAASIFNQPSENLTEQRLDSQKTLQQLQTESAMQRFKLELQSTLEAHMQTRNDLGGFENFEVWTQSLESQLSSSTGVQVQIILLGQGPAGSYQAGVVTTDDRVSPKFFAIRARSHDRTTGTMDFLEEKVAFQNRTLSDYSLIVAQQTKVPLSFGSTDFSGRLGVFFDPLNINRAQECVRNSCEPGSSPFILNFEPLAETGPFFAQSKFETNLPVGSMENQSLVNGADSSLVIFEQGVSEGVKAPTEPLYKGFYNLVNDEQTILIEQGLSSQPFEIYFSSDESECRMHYREFECGNSMEYLCEWQDRQIDIQSNDVIHIRGNANLKNKPGAYHSDVCQNFSLAITEGDLQLNASLLKPSGSQKSMAIFTSDTKANITRNTLLLTGQKIQDVPAGQSLSGSTSLQLDASFVAANSLQDVRYNTNGFGFDSEVYNGPTNLGEIVINGLLAVPQLPFSKTVVDGQLKGFETVKINTSNMNSHTSPPGLELDLTGRWPATVLSQTHRSYELDDLSASANEL